MKNLKTYLLAFVTLIVASIAFMSCGKSPIPNDKINKVVEVPNGYKPGPTVHNQPVEVIDTFYQLSPTWGQANYYASERGDRTIWVIITFVLLVVFLIIVYGLISEASWMPKMDPKGSGALLFILAAGILVSFKWQAAAIKWNNYHEIPKSQYDYYMKKDNSTKAIWDSLESGYHIPYGPYRKK